MLYYTKLGNDTHHPLSLRNAYRQCDDTGFDTRAMLLDFLDGCHSDNGLF